jgi:hypothetical protein
MGAEFAGLWCLREIAKANICNGVYAHQGPIPISLIVIELSLT